MIPRQYLTIERILLAAVLFFSCSDNKSVGQESSDYLLRKPAEPTVFRTVEIPVNLEQEREFQREVERGGQTWRLNAEDVACAYLRTLPEGADVKYCWGRQENKTSALVTTVINRTQYRLYLRRLIKSDGIWTPVKLEVELK